MNCEQIRMGGLSHIFPRKNYRDQHFMVCQDIIDAVVSSANVNYGDTVLEIGPGPGQLTETILQKGANVIVIEIDTRFRLILEEIKERYPDKLEIIWGSAIEVIWPDSCNKIVMNPPFSILESLLELLYEYDQMECVSMVIGKKYYNNCTIKPGHGSYTKTALITQAKFTPEFIMDIPKDCFYPQAGEKCVAMKLKVDKKPNPILKRLSDMYLLDHQMSVNFAVEQALEVLNKRAKKYRNMEKIVTFQNLGINPKLKNKLLQDLANYELAGIVSKLTSKLNQQRKRR